MISKNDTAFYICDLSDPSATAERKHMISAYPTIEGFY
jgi:hypothetical protein